MLEMKAIDIFFRIATAEDLPELVEMINLAYRREAPDSDWKTESSLLGGQRTDSGTLEKTILTQGSVILLIVREDAILGCVHLEKKSDFAYLGLLTIHPDYQNQRLAKKLLTHSEEFVTQHWHLKKIKMTVIGQRTELIAYYQRFGYAIVGEREAFPYGDPKFGKPKRDDLYFEVLAKHL